jgi:hypothetical protein
VELMSSCPVKITIASMPCAGGSECFHRL